MINHVSKPIMERFKVNKFVETGILQGDTLMIVQDWFIEWFGPQFNSGPWVAIPAPNGMRSQFKPEPHPTAKMYEIDFNEAVIKNTNHMKAQGNINIHVERAESTEWLKRNLGEFGPNDSVFFYLDAHDDSSLPEAYNGGAPVENSPKKQPLREEIETIMTLQNKPIISIDDWTIPGGYQDVYYLDYIRDLIRGRTDAIYYSQHWNLHGKFSAFIFIDRYSAELQETLKGLPLIKQRI